ncbi:MAG TPA: hypothetical protein VIK14_00285 [Ignavibacteria bacterium]
MDYAGLRKLPQLPCRYSAFGASARPKFNPDERTITQVYFINLNIYPMTNPVTETPLKDLTTLEMQ